MDDLPAFDSRQLDYLHDTSFLLSKWKIISGLQQLLASTEQTLVKKVQEEDPPQLPENCLKAAGKISRGENYRGLPYLVLDYPRLFNRQDIFTFRSMCWWGNFFSCTLHLQGALLDAYRPALIQNLARTPFQDRDTWLGVNQSPWEYHYEPDNYQLLHDLCADQQKALLNRKFFKISRKLPLKDYPELPSFASRCFNDFLSLLT